jgi:hypothetical protein
MHSSARVRALGALVCCAAVASCARSSASLRTSTDPAIETAAVHAVALFPIRNARLLPEESRELNRDFARAFATQNPDVTVVGPAEAIDGLNNASLADRYSQFLRDYAESGIPNQGVLRDVGAALHVDGIFQGEVFDMRQRDGTFAIAKAETQVTVRYALLATKDGTVLWEGTSRGVKGSATTLGHAAPMYEAIALAQGKILSAMPRLGAPVSH